MYIVRQHGTSSQSSKCVSTLISQIIFCLVFVIQIECYVKTFSMLPQNSLYVQIHHHTASERERKQCATRKISFYFNDSFQNNSINLNCACFKFERSFHRGMVRYFTQYYLVVFHTFYLGRFYAIFYSASRIKKTPDWRIFF